MGKMARQQKYQKANSDALRAVLYDQKSPDTTTAARRKEAVNKLNSVSAPRTKSSPKKVKSAPDRAHDPKRVANIDNDSAYDSDQKNSRMFDAGYPGIV
jgi:hypothetical protein